MQTVQMSLFVKSSTSHAFSLLTVRMAALGRTSFAWKITEEESFKRNTFPLPELGSDIKNTSSFF